MYVVCCLCYRLSAPPPVWVVQYKNDLGWGEAHLNSKDEDFQMVNLSEQLAWQRPQRSPVKLRCWEPGTVAS